MKGLNDLGRSRNSPGSGRKGRILPGKTGKAKAVGARAVWLRRRGFGVDQGADFINPSV